MSAGVAVLNSAHRAAPIGCATLVSTALPPSSHLVRLHPAPGQPYDRMIVVTERDGGRELFLSGWIGPPLTLSHWRAAKAALFPAAETVVWERRSADGSLRRVAVRV